jgi:hypothetical protein
MQFTAELVALLGLSGDAVQSIMGRAVVRGLDRRGAAPINHIGSDQKSFGKGHDSITVLTQAALPILGHRAKGALDRKGMGVQGISLVLEARVSDECQGLLQAVVWMGSALPPSADRLQPPSTKELKKGTYDTGFLTRRMGWDSIPRASFAAAGFQGRRSPSGDCRSVCA